MHVSLLLLQVFASSALAGLIWFVQVVHYPLYSQVGRGEFCSYEARHTSRTSCVVMPLMLTELGLAATIMFSPPAHLVGSPLPLIGAALVFVAWLSTFALSVPCHRGLIRGFDPVLAARLVNTNWIRCAAWTGRAVVSLLMLPLASA